MIPKLTQLQEIYKLTEPECRLNCRCLQSFCSSEYCDLAEEFAKEQDVILQIQSHPRLKYMGPKGCIVPLHLRPLCTLHVCSINGYGFKPGDDNWTGKYFKL